MNAVKVYHRKFGDHDFETETEFSATDHIVAERVARNVNVLAPTDTSSSTQLTGFWFHEFMRELPAEASTLKPDEVKAWHQRLLSGEPWSLYEVQLFIIFMHEVVHVALDVEATASWDSEEMEREI